MTRMIAEDGPCTAAYWQERAKEARLKTKEIGTVSSRAVLAAVAEIYDRMADRAHAREITHSGKRSSAPETFREMALRHIREQEGRIAEQKEIIETLAAAGESTILVSEVLESMEVTLAAMRAEVDRCSTN